MRARLSVTGLGIVVALALIPTDLGAVGAAPPSKVSTALSVCQQNGWQSLTNGQGQSFSNQGECISYFIHNPVTLADLAGSFSGTGNGISFSGCPVLSGFPPLSLVFDATYTATFGSVTIVLVGCADVAAPSEGFWAGTFTITTNVGTLAGHAAGPTSNPFGLPPFSFDLTLTDLSGTGAFAAATGTIDVFVKWAGGGVPQPAPITGSVTIP
jgi:hypothetical protein